MRSFPIKAKLALGLALFSTITLAALAAFILSRSRDALVEETTHRGNLIANNLASYSSNALLLKDTLSLAGLVAEAMKNEGVVLAVLTDPQGHILADGSQDLARIGQSFQAPEADEDLLFLHVPVDKNKIHIGDAYVGLSQAGIQTLVRGLTRDVVMLSLGFLAFGLVAALLMATAIASPVKRLTEGAIAIGQGLLDTRLEVRSTDEIGVLARSFNEMAGNLKRGQNALVEKELLEKDLAIAQEIQSRLIPKVIPQATGFAISGYYQPAQVVGGDYFDVIALGAGRIGLVVADVSGKGVSGCLGMAMARSEIGAWANGPVDEVLAQVNAGLRPEFNGELFVSLYYAVLDERTGTVDCASAGHGPAYVLNAQGRLRLVHPSGPVLGVFPPELFRCQSERIQLEPGETLILVTDGIVEARNAAGEFYEEERFMQLLRQHKDSSLEQLKQGILDGVAAFVGGAPPHDDITLLLLKRQATS